jgi:hypothetical protein
VSRTTQFVTVWDPSGSLAVGELVDGVAAVTVAKARKGVVLLPADPQVLYSASPGFGYRPWGKGWLYDNVTPERGCPMMIAVTEQTWLYWAVQVLPIRDGEPMTGQLRMIGNGAAGGMMGLSQDVRARTLAEYSPGPKGGLVIGGRCAIGVQSPGMLGLSVHGIGRNVRVLWSAVSVTSEKVEVQDGVPV